MHLPDNFLQAETDEGFVFSKSSVITNDQMAVLIVKPSNDTPNANNSVQNVRSIAGRIEAKGWQVHSLKVTAGGVTNIDKIAAHYSQPFYDRELESARTQLSHAEQQKLIEIWGDEATDYALYHPMRLSKAGVMDFKTAAKIWHQGRGTDNRLLDVGHPAGINSVTTEKSQQYGKRRLLLVRSEKEPFFMVNGFTAEMVTKFSRPEERIVIMVIVQKEPTYDLGYLREHVVGETNPRKARPGSIRYDAVHQEAYDGRFPIGSKDEVGIENNIVHLSENLSEAKRELAIWAPELFWYPSQGEFAPDIAYSTWLRLKKYYLRRSSEQTATRLTPPAPEKLVKLSDLPSPKSLPTLSVNMMAGGSGGRLFGYKIPESERNKLSAPLVPIGGRRRSFLELQLTRLAAGKKAITSVNIIASESSGQAIRHALEDLATTQPRLAPIIKRSSVLIRQNVPRIVPKAEDLLKDGKFQTYCKAQGIEMQKYAADIARSAGEIAHTTRGIASKPPGHLSVFLNYMYNRLRDDLKNGVQVAYFHIGEDSAARPSAALLQHAAASSSVAHVCFVKAPSPDHGFLVQDGNAFRILEAADRSPDLPGPYYLHTCRMVFNVRNLATFLAGTADNFARMSEHELREQVSTKIIDKLTPRFEIKPVENYAFWAGQFAYTIGQIIEVVPTELIDDDVSVQKVTTFKTASDLEEMLPLIRAEFEAY